jgi:pantoate--beta-alanine ligase
MLEVGRAESMITVTTIAGVRAQVARWHEAHERVVFVPTMGNLHAGHMSLLAAARKHGKRFVASIFVNPMQFGPNEDFAHYPRTPTQDAKMLNEAGCDLMFSPEVGEIYPNGANNATRIEVPGISNILCGEFRPGHFEGVATIVAKLFHIVDPDVAIFGEKDFQQLTVIRRMVADLCLRVEVVGAPTVRESDGLAMSSRNQYLDEQQRRLAPSIYRQLQQAVEALKSGVRDFARIEATGRAALDGAGFRTDYFSVRDARTLAPASPDTRHFVVLTAARLGKARLIDNLQWSIAVPGGESRDNP